MVPVTERLEGGNDDDGDSGDNICDYDHDCDADQMMILVRAMMIIIGNCR